MQAASRFSKTEPGLDPSVMLSRACNPLLCVCRFQQEHLGRLRFATHGHGDSTHLFVPEPTLMTKMLTWMTFCPLKEPFGKSETHTHRLELSTGGCQEAFEKIERDKSQNRGKIDPPNRRNHATEDI